MNDRDSTFDTDSSTMASVPEPPPLPVAVDDDADDETSYSTVAETSDDDDDPLYAPLSVSVGEPCAIPAERSRRASRTALQGFAAAAMLSAYPVFDHAVTDQRFDTETFVIPFVTALLTAAVAAFYPNLKRH